MEKVLQRTDERNQLATFAWIVEAMAALRFANTIVASRRPVTRASSLSGCIKSSRNASLPRVNRLSPWRVNICLLSVSTDAAVPRRFFYFVAPSTPDPRSIAAFADRRPLVENLLDTVHALNLLDSLRARALTRRNPAG
jgi:hypothetical protein